MPLLQMSTSAPLPDQETRARRLAHLSALIARELDKPEQYVMVMLNERSDMMFAGNSQAACYAELKNVGAFSPRDTERLSAVLCAEIGHALGVAQDRVYIEFTNVDGALWGWKGGTFA